MRSKLILLLLAVLTISCQINTQKKSLSETTAFNPNTTISIKGEKFYINGNPTFNGRTWEGVSVEGLLPNSRMVQGIFDDLNPETAIRWDYPDGKWSAERNINEFVTAMDEWRAHDCWLLLLTCRV